MVRLSRAKATEVRKARTAAEAAKKIEMDRRKAERIMRIPRARRSMAQKHFSFKVLGDAALELPPSDAEGNSSEEDRRVHVKSCRAKLAATPPPASSHGRASSSSVPALAAVAASAATGATGGAASTPTVADLSNQAAAVEVSETSATPASPAPCANAKPALATKRSETAEWFKPLAAAPPKAQTAPAAERMAALRARLHLPVTSGADQPASQAAAAKAQGKRRRVAHGDPGARPPDS